MNPIDSGHRISATPAVEKAKGRLLIVDDEEHIREILAATLEPLVDKIFLAGSAEEAIEVTREENLDVVVCDVRMPGMDGLEFLHKVKTEQPGLRFLMITAHGSMDTAVKALRYGANDFLTKPFENREIREVVARLLRERQGAQWPAVPPPSPAETTRLMGVVGESVAFTQCMEMAKRAAAGDSSVLLTGESGTGKEVFARAIHTLSARSDRPFIAVNCGAIPENLVESELFGHEKGAFTGAIASKPGKFFLASSGTIFLDELGELPLNVQVKLLRVLQERVIEPVGATRPVKVDFRLIAATNRNLKEEVRLGRFREDLFYRLNIIPIALPPLRDRAEDIVPLSRYFLKVFNERYGAQFSLSTDNERVLRSYAWPGNVRELGNTIERAVVLAGKEGLLFQFEGAESPSQIPSQSAGYANTGRPTTEGQGLSEWVEEAKPSTSTDTFARADLRSRKAAVERDEILRALEKNRWNKTQTAEFLGMSRRSLLYKIKEYGIS
jgi:two-component system, NtrC family, response regulator AtoC